MLLVGAVEIAQTLAWTNPTCTGPQIPQLVKPDLSHLQEPSSSVGVFRRHWIYGAGSGGVNL